MFKSGNHREGFWYLFLSITLLAILFAVASICASCVVEKTKTTKTEPQKGREKAVETREKKPEYETGIVLGLEEQGVITVEAGPKSVELMPQGKRLFVNDLYARKNFIFDADNYLLLKTIPLPDEPVEADFTGRGRFAWVSLYNSAKVVIVDTEAGAVVGEVPTGNIPKEVAASPDGTWVYVANWNSSSVTVIDAGTRQPAAQISVPGIPRGMCFSPDGTFAYVCNMGGSTLTEVDVEAGHRVTRQIPCGSNPRHVVPSRDGAVLYVSNNSPGTVTLVDRLAGAVIDTVKVGRQARTIAIAPDGRYLFVCNYGDNTVGCVDLEARAQIFTVPQSRPIGMTVSSKGDRLFVSNYAPPRITVLRIAREPAALSPNARFTGRLETGQGIRVRDKGRSNR